MRCKANDTCWVTGRFGGTNCDKNLPGRVVVVRDVVMVNGAPSWTYEAEGSSAVCGKLTCDCGINVFDTLPDAMLTPWPKEKLEDDADAGMETVKKVSSPKTEDAPLERVPAEILTGLR